MKEIERKSQEDSKEKNQTVKSGFWPKFGLLGQKRANLSPKSNSNDTFEHLFQSKMGHLWPLFMTLLIQMLTQNYVVQNILKSENFTLIYVI